MAGKISHRCCWPNPTRQNPFLSCEEVWQDSECEVIIYLICSLNKLLHLVWDSLVSGFWLDLRVDDNQWRCKLCDHLFSSEEMFLGVVQSRFSIPIFLVSHLFFEAVCMNWNVMATSKRGLFVILIHCNIQCIILLICFL